MIQPDWCKNACPKLAAFNRAYITRKGKGLVPFIELKGTEEEILFCVQQESQLLFEANLMINESICTNPADTSSPQTVYLKNAKRVDNPIPGNLYFLQTCEDPIRNSFVITGCKTASLIPDIVEALGFDELTEEVFLSAIHDYPWQTYEKDVLVNNTILRHYEKHEDNKFYADDLAWMQKASPVARPAKQMSPMEPVAKTISPAAPVTPAENPKQKGKQLEHPHMAQQEEKHGPKMVPLKKAPANVHAKAPMQNHPHNKDTVVKDNIANLVAESLALDMPEKNVSPVEEKKEGSPVPQYKKEEAHQNKNVKESLTEEEIKKNNELLESLLGFYNEMQIFIESLKNAKWRSIQNKMRDVVNKKKFTIQWCPLYLEVSDDVSTELYAKLYDLDQKTEQFHQDVIHQVQHLGCPNCGKPWDEDITFLPSGIHFVECPYCFSERGFEKS